MNEIVQFFRAHPTLWEWVKLVLVAAGTFIVLMIVLRLERKAAKRLLQKKDNIHLLFVEKITRFVLIIVAVQFVVFSSKVTQPFGKVLFQGTTVIAAIAGFAAQPVIADLICGLMLSSMRPFDMGDRIEMEDGTAGIVKDITMRHVVLQGVDTMDIIVPNSKLNGMRIRNMSRSPIGGMRSIYFTFGVAYHTDVEKAIAVVRQAVEECPYSVPGKPGPDGPDYAPVYFMDFEDSSLQLATTVYYTASHSTEMVKSDINSRVKGALEAAGIEIPYNYVNVVFSDRKGNRVEVRDKI
ncbi:MAG: mechanosensitive ion channel family protein [Clostridia bacterium]|nr:mechanosensitive ion channel family protein [Clostridia bacterium]